MSDEIKEILNDIKDIVDAYVKNCDYKENDIIYDEVNFSVKQWNELLDYITNLQEKYNNSQITLAEEWKKRLEAEEKNKHLDNQITMLKQQNNAITEMGLDYKSKNKKATEKLESIRAFGLRSGKTLFSTLINETIDILNGGELDER